MSWLAQRHGIIGNGLAKSCDRGDESRLPWRFIEQLGDLETRIPDQWIGASPDRIFGSDNGIYLGRRTSRFDLRTANNDCVVERKKGY